MIVIIIIAKPRERQAAAAAAASKTQHTLPSLFFCPLEWDKRPLQGKINFDKLDRSPCLNARAFTPLGKKVSIRIEFCSDWTRIIDGMHPCFSPPIVPLAQPTLLRRNSYPSCVPIEIRHGKMEHPPTPTEFEVCFRLHDENWHSNLNLTTDT